MTEAVQSQAYGQGYRLTPVDKFGLWLSTRKLRSVLPSLKGLKIADVGCGYNASFVRSVLADVGRAIVVDVALADDLKQNDKVQAIQGALPDALKAIPDGTLDLVLCNNVIEHLWEPLATLREVHRIMARRRLRFRQRAVVARQVVPGIFRVPSRHQSGFGDE